MLPDLVCFCYPGRPSCCSKYTCTRRLCPALVHLESGTISIDQITRPRCRRRCLSRSGDWALDRLKHFLLVGCPPEVTLMFGSLLEVMHKTEVVKAQIRGRRWRRCSAQVLCCPGKMLPGCCAKRPGLIRFKCGERGGRPPGCLQHCNRFCSEQRLM